MNTERYKQLSRTRQVTEKGKVKHDILRGFWIFLLGGVVGVVFETIWCYFAFGQLSSRTSNLFFPFSIVWAVGALLLQFMIDISENEGDILFFIKSCILIGGFEFLCGFLGEKLLGVTFWDYRGLPLHIGKYINVFICLIWGGLSVVWRKWVSPGFCIKIDELLKKQLGARLSKILLCFMIITNLISGMALLRMESRRLDTRPPSGIEHILDVCFPDKVLQSYFPKMKYLSGDKIYSEN